MFYILQAEEIGAYGRPRLEFIIFFIMILDIYKKKANIAFFEEAVENGYRMSIALEYDGNYYYRVRVHEADATRLLACERLNRPVATDRIVWQPSIRCTVA